MKKTRYFALSMIIIILAGCSTVQVEEKLTPDQITSHLKEDIKSRALDFFIPYGSNLVDVQFIEAEKKINFYFNRAFSFRPFRTEDIVPIKEELRDYYGLEFSSYDVGVFTMDYSIEELIPNFYRDSKNIDESRIFSINNRPKAVKENLSSLNNPSLGLQDRTIVLWHSHGWYYSVDAQRWEWQRPRLFQTVEDLIPMSFTIPYLIPMLENAGAVVFVPRERDFQTHEVVVDNDTENDIRNKSYIEYTGEDNEWKTVNSGFAFGTQPYEVNFNPFDHGTSKEVIAEKNETAQVRWIPEIPETGEYGVYISYQSSDLNVDDARYSVYHEGGVTVYEINQQVGGGTWIYLGKFKFKSGKNDNRGVLLSNQSSTPGRIVSADAVRFGGGMGIINREGSTSGRPKFVEGAKYFMQYAGLPDSLVYNLNDNKNDYNDDYRSRPEFVNYLYGAPFGPNKNKNVKGLGIPVDLSMAFHTDAGITRNDTTIGTLTIYSTTAYDTSDVFPNGKSRIANRDLADLVQTSIVDDLRKKYDNAWNRRQLRNARYTEAVGPNVPSLLMELLSHQNFLDMQFMLDPQFRFDVSRAMYKGMLKYLSVQNNRAYIVQPLPVTDFSVEFNSNNNVVLNWKPQVDPLEPTANAEKFLVYMRIEDGGFDNGTLVEEPTINFDNLKDSVIYSFKITALNDGGESFPSEILSVCRMNDEKPVLIINAFDRVSAPAKIETEKFSGFINKLDNGVPDKYDINFTGEQYDFDPVSEFLTNDAPGHGASFADYETKIIAGNSFDYPYMHGKSISAAGYSFVSVSDEAVYNGSVQMNNYSIADIILGEEKEISWQKPFADSINGKKFKTFNSEFKSKVDQFVDNGGNLFVSGAYVGTDLFNWSNIDSTATSFAAGTLKIKLETNYASRTGEVFSTKDSFLDNMSFKFNTELNKYIYAVEGPDALAPANGSKAILRYSENQFIAGTAFEGSYRAAIFGFPFETILSQRDRDQVMKSVLKFLDK